MYTIILCLCCVVLLPVRGDTECNNLGGTCSYTDQYPCNEGYYEAGHCTGPTNRQCCLLYSDPQCDAAQGYCAYIPGTTCDSMMGEYVTGLCAGPTNRKCCKPYDDPACDLLGGTCQDSTAAPSNCDSMFGQYVTGQCSGPTARKCCAPYTDPKCDAVGGTCQDTAQVCVGSYQTGLCSGPTNRKCCLPTAPPPPTDYTLRGDIRLLSPTGQASGGVSASQNAISADMTELNAYKGCLYSIGNEFKIHPSLIGAIASRESLVGRYINRSPFGWGDYRNGRYNAYGILQCDVYTSGLGKECLSHPWDSCEHMRMMVEKVLLVKYAQVKAPGHPASTWLPERQVQAMVAAYNFGAGNVQTWEGLDVGTAHNDYSNDVVARAQYLINSKGWD